MSKVTKGSRPPKAAAKPKPFHGRPDTIAETAPVVLVDDYSIQGESNVSTNPNLPDGGPSPGPLPQEAPSRPTSGGNPSLGGQQQQNKPSR
jgi:hypothetical protein